MSKENQIIPRGEWVLIKPTEKSDKETEQGLILPDAEEKEQKATGMVLLVGNKVSKDIAPSSKVIYGAFAGENVKVIEDGKEVEYKLLHDEDIIAFAL